MSDSIPAVFEQQSRAMTDDTLVSELHEAIGDIIADERRLLQRDRDLAEANLRAMLADARAQLAELRQSFEATARQRLDDVVAAIHARLEHVRDGEPGPRGEKGDKGDAGEQGPEGIAGAAGAVGPKGDQGNDGVPGPEGPAGVAGIDGESGPPGPAGPAGNSVVAGKGAPTLEMRVGTIYLDTETGNLYEFKS